MSEPSGHQQVSTLSDNDHKVKLTATLVLVKYRDAWRYRESQHERDVFLFSISQFRPNMGRRLLRFKDLYFVEDVTALYRYKEFE